MSEDELEDDWETLKGVFQKHAETPRSHPEDLEAGWRALRGLPDELYFVNTLAENPDGSNLPLPQIWLLYVTGKKVTEFREKKQIEWQVYLKAVLWSCQPHYSIRLHAFSVRDDEVHPTLDEAVAHLRKRRENIIAARELGIQELVRQLETELEARQQTLALIRSIPVEVTDACRVERTAQDLLSQPDAREFYAGMNRKFLCKSAGTSSEETLEIFDIGNDY